MPWNNQGGGWQGGGGRGPWGGPPPGGSGGGGGGGPTPPNLEELLRKGQDSVKGFLPGGGWGVRGVALVVLGVLVVWGLSGFYRVQQDEVGVVTMFGQYTAPPKPPGLHWRPPSPIAEVETPAVTKVNRIDVGFRSAGELGRPVAATRDVVEESLMLTGDENIVDIDFAVFWVIKDAPAYLFNIQHPANTVKAVAESAMREVVGQRRIDDVLTEGREEVEIRTQETMQRTLDDYGAGINITQVKLQKSDPPTQVIDAFRDVQAARADQERLRNEAFAYANDVVPRARGEAEQIRLEAEGYKEQIVSQALGDASRFSAVLGQYVKAKDVIRQRIYLETMEAVLGGMNKMVIDSGVSGAAAGGGNGIVPYLPLNELMPRGRQNVVDTRTGSGAASSQ